MSLKYVCCRCGEVLEEDIDDIVIDPDGDAECTECYEANRDEWFDEPEKESEPETPVEESKLYTPTIGYDGKPIKKSLFGRHRDG